MVDVNIDQKFFSAGRAQHPASSPAQATQTLELMARAGRRLENALQEGLAAAGLTAAQGRAMRTIAAEPGLPVSRLTARLGISKQSLAPVLKALSRRGLVAAEGTHADRRRRHLHLTAEGRAVWEAAAHRAMAVLGAVAADAEPAQASGFYAVLQRLAQSAEQGP